MNKSNVVYLENALESLVCTSNSGCGIQFAVPQDFINQARKRGFEFYCPRGHRLTFGESEIDQLQKKLEHEKKRTEWAQQDAKTAKRSAAAYKVKVEHLKSRVGNGVCPCCKRNFTNLRRHMNTKHPDYATETPRAKGDRK